MTKTTRRFLFYGLFILFIPLSIAIILYSTGWRLNAEKCSDIQLLNCLGIRKTGAIYIETKPKGVKIEINGEIFEDQSGLIQSGTLISNLPPKNYEVKIEKDDYLFYYKNISVAPSMVSELIDTILITEKIEKQEIINNKLRGDKIIDLSNDTRKIIIKNSKTNNYYLYNFSDQKSVLNINAAFNNIKASEIAKISFHPFDSNRLIIEGENGLYIFDTNRLKLEIITGKTIFWLTKNSSVYYLKETTDEKSPKTKNYSLNSFNLILRTESEILKPQTKANNFAKFDISDSGDRFALIDSLDNLYIFSNNSKELKQIAHNAKDFLFSPDNKKIAFFDQNGQLNIHFIEDWYKNSRRIAGDASRFGYAEKSSEISDIYWHNSSYHLIIGYENNIEFTEIDDRPPLNKYRIIEADDFYYNPELSKIYFIQKEKLYSFEI
ncbi:MAG: PEGA domain-containing protein [Patescibacteria group bacterium]